MMLRQFNRVRPWVVSGLVGGGLVMGVPALAWSPTVPSAASVAEGAVPPVSFSTLTLAQAEALLRERNRDLTLARHAVRAAQAGLAQADVRPNPTLSWTGQHLRARRPGVTGQLDQVVTYSDTWERGGKRSLRVAQAEAALGGRQADEADALRQALLAVRVAWTDLLLAERRQKLAQSTVEVLDRSLAAAKRRVQAGDLAGADAARLRVEVERAHVDLTTAQAERQRARIALGSLLAVEGQALSLATDGRWPAVAAAPADASLDAQVDARPDVLSALRAVEAADRAVELSRAQRRRDLTWSVLAERDRGSDTGGTTVGLGVAVPLLWGNDYRGDLRKAEADSDAARVRLDQVRAAAHSDILRAGADLNAALAKWDRYEGGLVQSAQRTAEAAEYAYSRGAMGLMDVLDARRTLHAVQVEALEARAAVVRAWAASEAAAAAGPSP